MSRESIYVPPIGLGTYRMRDKDGEQAVFNALTLGYRLIDTAAVYRNEKEVGQAVRDFLVQNPTISRKDIFITTKLSPRSHGFNKALEAFHKSNQELSLGYIDCFLVHWPGTAGWKPDDIRHTDSRRQSWLALEQLHSSVENLVQNIGISNYTIKHIRELLEFASVRPALLQTEFHPLLFQRDLLEYCYDNKIRVQAYSSFGEGELLEHGKMIIPGLDKICQKHDKNYAQVLLRWALDHEVAVIPKTVSRTRMEQNLNVFDFQLDAEDMEILDTADQGHHFCWNPETII